MPRHACKKDWSKGWSTLTQGWEKVEPNHTGYIILGSKWVCRMLFIKWKKQHTHKENNQYFYQKLLSILLLTSHHNCVGHLLQVKWLCSVFVLSNSCLVEMFKCFSSPTPAHFFSQIHFIHFALSYRQIDAFIPQRVTPCFTETAWQTKAWGDACGQTAVSSPIIWPASAIADYLHGNQWCLAALANCWQWWQQHV